MIDYMFFSRNSLRTVGLLGPFDMDWIKSNKIVGFPHPHVPSDHLPLMVELEIVSNQNGSMNTNGNSNGNYHYQQTNLNNNSNSSSRQVLHHSSSGSNGVAQFGQMIPINNQNFLRK